LQGRSASGARPGHRADRHRPRTQRRRVPGEGGGAAPLRMILPLRLEAVAYRGIIEPLTLELEAGASTVLLGANGAGKSVLMRLMHGLLAPTEGKITWSGENPRRHQAMVFQRPVMLRRSALANVVYALSVAGVADAHRIAMGALKEVGLAPLANRPARALSPAYH